ncbi:MAG: ATP-binding protein [Acidobacteriota bacterium]|nr:ATP-binding protein [Acidobacteriota bacterium]
MPRTARQHFNLWSFAAVLHLIDRLRGAGVVEAFPFLNFYLEDAVAVAGGHEPQQWRQRIEVWEKDVDVHLPLRALREQVEINAETLLLLLTIGLPEEDPRFAPLFEWAQPSCPGQQRPTMGLFTAWWRGDDDSTRVRQSVDELHSLGAIETVNSDAPRFQWAFQPSPCIWDALRGDVRAQPADGLVLRAPHDQPPLEDLVLPTDIAAKARRLPSLLMQRQISAVLVRGPLRNGRGTLLGAIAAASGHSLLEIRGSWKEGESRVVWLGTLCTLLNAVPLFRFELGMGEIAALPAMWGYRGPCFATVSRHGVVTTPGEQPALTLELPLPDIEARGELWRRHLPGPEEAARPTAHFRITTGNIVRAAGLATAQAALEGRAGVSAADLRYARRGIEQPLENLAARLEGGETWQQIVCPPDTIAELRTLENRCRFRERLESASGCGVRALLTGPSGTGKTLAARVLASELGMDIYRLDLSSVVNKYIGETEKNLNAVFSRAEELDIVLLLDEGDSLLTGRTSVQNSNDRYANLETNFLLQRFESFEGILLVTTNASQRIDAAFQRRMDVVVDFRMPEPEERLGLWNIHLPFPHRVDPVWLEEMACRCTLSGGQIRNAALHAELLALDARQPVLTNYLERAVQREYQKTGAVCPLRARAFAGGPS